MLQGTDKNEQSDSAETNHFFNYYYYWLSYELQKDTGLKAVQLLHMWEGWELWLGTEDENGATEKIIFLPFFQN